MEVVISTFDTQAVLNLLGRDRFRQDDTIDLIPGIEVRIAQLYVRKTFGFPEIATFVITVGSAVAMNIASAAIWDWLKRLRNDPEMLTIDRQEVEFEEGAVKRVVTEHIESRRNKAA
jgi:hypothetical protein